MNVKTVYIEITNRCNLNCQTCYNRSGLNQTTEELSLQDIENIISLFSSYGAKRFLFSGGEPTLHSQFDKILTLIEKNPQYSFGFVTNGTIHNKNFIDFLNKAENLTLQISLDGSCEEQNAKTRGVGNFKAATDFAWQISNPSLHPLLKMVISQDNYADIESFYRMAVSLGCTPEYAFIYKSGNGSEDWDRKKVSPQNKIKALTLIDRLNSEFNISAFLPRCTYSCPYTVGSKDMSVCVKTDGSIQPCQTLYSSEYTLANVLNFRKDTFEENVCKLISIAKKRSQTDFGCQKCIVNKICHKGCLAEAVNLTGDPLGDDDSCLTRKLQFLNFDIKKTDHPPIFSSSTSADS